MQLLTKIILMGLILISTGCDTLSLYRGEGDFRPVKDQVSFSKKFDNGSIKIEAKIYLFNFSIKSQLDIKNESSKDLYIVPQKIVLKSTSNNKEMPLRHLWMRSGNKNNQIKDLEAPIHFGPNETTSLIFEFDPSELMPPIRLMKNEELKFLVMILGGLGREKSELSPIYIPLSRQDN